MIPLPGLVTEFVELSAASLGAFEKLQNVTVSFIMSISLSMWNNLVPTRGILMELDI